MNKNLGGWALGENAFEAIRNLAPTRILELGSGTGSMELAKLCDVYSIEDNLEYVNKYEGSNVVHVPLNGIWYDVPTLIETLESIDYDLIVVDAPSGSFGRLGFLFNYPIFKKVPMLIDDTHREYEALMAKKFVEMGMQHKVINEIDKQATLLWAD